MPLRVENTMTSAKTIAIVVIPLIMLSLSTVSTMQPARATGMNLYAAYQNFNQCVGANSNTGIQYLYSNAGPSGKTWVVWVSIGLNGGDNVQYVEWSFNLTDPGSGNNFVGWTGASTYQWVNQGLSQYGSMSASFAGGLDLGMIIDNHDGVSQCFDVQITAWYY